MVPNVKALIQSFQNQERNWKWHHTEILFLLTNSFNIFLLWLQDRRHNCLIAIKVSHFQLLAIGRSSSRNRFSCLRCLNFFQILQSFVVLLDNLLVFQSMIDIFKHFYHCLALLRIAQHCLALFRIAQHYSASAILTVVCD